jgi:hypothetical protein
LSAFLLLLPGALSLLTLGAHFLRRGALLPMLSCLALVPLMGVRRPWAARTLQVALLLAALEWGRTLAALVPARRAAGSPWERPAVILAAVGLVALLSALAFELPALRRRFGRVTPGA